MDGRTSHALSDEALDQELTAAFSVDHSPEFLPRVRSRVAAEPVAPPWQLSWGAFAAPAIAVAVIALVWLRAPGAQQPAPTVARDVALAERPLPAETGAPLAIVAPRIVRRVGSAAPTSVQAVRAPQVLISRDEQRAFARLVELIDEGRLPPDAGTPEAGVPDQAVRAIEVVPIDAPPIEIKPLDESRRLE